MDRTFRQDRGSPCVVRRRSCDRPLRVVAAEHRKANRPRQPGKRLEAGAAASKRRSNGEEQRDGCCTKGDVAVKTRILTAMSAVVVCALVPTPGHAQVAPAPRAPASAGSTRGSTLGFIGISNVKCNCTFFTDDDGSRTFTFRSNPVVLGIYEGSPADGALERGDTITAIDGYALMTAEGARRFANIQPGQRITLNVSRGQRRMTLLLKASNAGWGDARAFGTRAPVVA